MQKLIGAETQSGPYAHREFGHRLRGHVIQPPIERALMAEHAVDQLQRQGPVSCIEPGTAAGRLQRIIREDVVALDGEQCLESYNPSRTGVGCGMRHPESRAD